MALTRGSGGKSGDTPLFESLRLGQSIWCDTLSRRLLNSGELQRLIDDEGLRGVTSNPTIFEKAVLSGQDYEEPFARLVQSGHSEAKPLYDALVIDDVRAAADLLFEAWVDSDQSDGFVSLEVSPHLAHDTSGTIAEAHHLFDEVNRKNLMIKVPGTSAGMPAIEVLIADGINVNVTLLFGLEAYRRCAEAFRKGMEKRYAAGDDLASVTSVASFFLSRIDTVVDEKIDQTLAGNPEPEQRRVLQGLKGKVAVANAKLAGVVFNQMSEDPRWRTLSAAGAHPQRLLWASTGTKNPAYSPTMYIDPLVGPHTVNTMPLETLSLYLERGRPRPTLHEGVEEARATMKALAEVGISIDEVTSALVDKGIASFSASYDRVITHLVHARERLLAQEAAGPAPSP
jgi:transaldolase/glucose-6-phosphate isomerase